jgi:hypothetical protein
MSVNMVFSPKLVLGFPALVMDRPAPSPDQIAAIESQLPRGQRFLPTQYLGKISRLSHNVHQGGGTSAVNLSHARTHRGLDDEFVGMLSREMENSKAVKCTRSFSPKELVNPFRRFVQFNEAVLTRIVRQVIEEKPIKGILLNRGEEVISSELSEETVTLLPNEVRQLGLTDLVGPLEAIADDFSLEVPKKITMGLRRKFNRGERRKLKISVEEAITPGWYSDVWRNENIGTDVYRPLLGCQALVDNVGLTANAQSELLKRSPETDSLQIERANIADNTCDGPLEESEEQSIPGSNTSFEVVSGSIEEAVDGLTILYGMLKENGIDVHKFIDDFTHRPIANMRDVLGSQDFKFNDLGQREPTLPDSVIEGFHTRAFGDYNTDVKLPDTEDATIQAGENALFALFPGSQGPDVKRSSLVHNTKKFEQAILPFLDPRGRARARVKAYKEELELSRGLSY